MGQAIWSESAYEGAIKRNIIANAQKTFCKTYPRGEEVLNYLHYYAHTEDSKNQFLVQLGQALHFKFGKLSARQYEVVCNHIDTAQERREAYAKAIEEQKAKSEFLGVANERITVTVTVEKEIAIDKPKFSYYDSSVAYLFLLRDADGNRLTWKTSSSPAFGEGDTVEIKATIKAHTEYKGEKQTVLQRVTLLKVVDKVN